MPLEFTCPACGKGLNAPFAAAGLAGNCKFCRARLIAPIAAGKPATMAPAQEAASAVGAPSGPASSHTGFSGLDSGAPSGPGYAPGATPMPPHDLLANPGVAKAFMYAGRPAVSDFWKRFIGFGIDMILISLMELGITVLMIGSEGRSVTNIFMASKAQMGVAMRLTFTLFAARVLYGALTEGSPLQATPGKWILGMKVCAEAGDRISFLVALWRNFCKWGIVGAVSFAPIIGIFPYAIFFYAMRDDLTQTLHDMMAGTVVAERSY